MYKILIENNEIILYVWINEEWRISKYIGEYTTNEIIGKLKCIFDKDYSFAGITKYDYVYTEIKSLNILEGN